MLAVGQCWTGLPAWLHPDCIQQIKKAANQITDSVLYLPAMFQVHCSSFFRSIRHLLNGACMLPYFWKPTKSQFLRSWKPCSRKAALFHHMWCAESTSAGEEVVHVNKRCQGVKSASAAVPLFSFWTCIRIPCLLSRMSQAIAIGPEWMCWQKQQFMDFKSFTVCVISVN